MKTTLGITITRPTVQMFHVSLFRLLWCNIFRHFFGLLQTSNQSTFLLHAVAANEEVQDRLYEEIRAVLGQDTLPLPEHLSKMPILKGCLQESYR